MAVNGDKPHVVCIPFPAQSHMKAMLKLAKLLHHEGFHKTFVNTEYDHKRFLRVRGPNSLDGLPDFRFETIPDGLPPWDRNTPQDVLSLRESIRKNALEPPFLSLVSKLNDSSASGPDVPPVTCIVSDGFTSFTITAGEENEGKSYGVEGTGREGYWFRWVIHFGLKHVGEESVRLYGRLATTYNFLTKATLVLV